jgi:hypothetical protein
MNYLVLLAIGAVAWVASKWWYDHGPRTFSEVENILFKTIHQAYRYPSKLTDDELTDLMAIEHFLATKNPSYIPTEVKEF